MNLQDCLPPDLRGPATSITRIAAGLSGAGVHRVEVDGRAFVLKVAGDTENADDWRSTLQIQQLAASAELAPRIVHVDEGRRAVLSEFVADRSFVTLYRDPLTHDAAVDELGRTVRRIHMLPFPPDARARDPLAFLAQLRLSLQGLPLPDFARRAIDRAQAEVPPPRDRPRVLAHNDLNPTNFIYDGEKILLLDWATAGANDPLYDLAVVAVFLRMDQANSLRLLSAYDNDQPVAQLPARFAYQRRVVAALGGTAQLFIARQLEHPGASEADTFESVLPLGEFYQRLASGALRLGTPEAQWAFGLSLLKESLAL
jgi:aminoglycoside phosphotransferase (APT) family kinase protein